MPSKADESKAEVATGSEAMRPSRRSTALAVARTEEDSAAVRPARRGFDSM